MRYVRLGKTDLDVSAVAFGTWAFGGEWWILSSAVPVTGPSPEGT